MYELNRIIDTLIVGDILNELKQFQDNCIDIIVTSPPYNKNSNSNGWLVQNNGYSHFDDAMTESDYQKWQINILDELFRVTKPGGSMFYNHKIRWDKGKLLHPYEWISKSSWNMRQELIWNRTLASNVRGWRFWQIEERIYWLYKPIGDHLVGEELESCHAKLGSIWQINPVPRNKNHPAPFPIEIPLRVIYSLCGRNKQVVLDPFCGTGTTLVAAKLMGHHYIGIDISPDYIDYAKKRLSDYRDEKEIWENEKKKHVVKDPFKNRKQRGTVNWPYGPENHNRKKE